MSGEGEKMNCFPSLAKQFEEFRLHLEECRNLRVKIRLVVTKIESITSVLTANLLLVHQSHPIPNILEEANSQVCQLRECYGDLSALISNCPDEYYRYHDVWKNETSAVVSQLAFMHWLAKGSLLFHSEAEELLGLNNSVFALDLEDYLIGICFMSNEMPRYVVNRATSGDYECPRKVFKFLRDLYACFLKLNLRNDFLRKKVDSLKYDLKRVEEVFYDVNIRGLIPDKDSSGDPLVDVN